MAGRRPLTAIEERKLLKVTRRLSPRDRAFITCEWLLGYRLSERKSWAMHVYKNSGICILTVKAALDHSSVEVSQKRPW